MKFERGIQHKRLKVAGSNLLQLPPELSAVDCRIQCNRIYQKLCAMLLLLEHSTKRMNAQIFT